MRYAFAVLWLLLSPGAYSQTCALPGESPGEPYKTIARASDRDLRLLLNEYMYQHSWTGHDDAMSAGFRTGDRVYGEVLKNDHRQFNPSAVRQWRRSYEKSSRRSFLASAGKTIDMASVDATVIKWVLQRCLDAGLWSRVTATDECRFQFSAGLRRTSQSIPIKIDNLQVEGGRCSAWPDGALTARGVSVNCVRNGDRDVVLTLTTEGAGTTTLTLPALEPVPVPAEPVLETRQAEPAAEVFRLTRSQDFRLVALGAGCPACKLYAADIRPSTPDAAIVAAATIASNGAGWQRCPAGLRCRAYEFSPPEDPHVAGCSGAGACRVWRLAETDAEAVDVIQLTVQASESVCVNCPPGVDYQTARVTWQAAKAQAAARCTDMRPR